MIGKVICKTRYWKVRGTDSAYTLRILFFQKIIGFNKNVYWPVHHSSRVNGYKNILIGFGTKPGYQPGCYIQGGGEIFIGNHVRIAPNVGVISANHDIYDYSKHIKSKVNIGNYCWLGMNSVVLPGVTLGDDTIVAAGAVVTKSFPDGYCVIGGTPARIIKQIDPDKVVKYDSKYKYHGYVPHEKFEEFRKKKLNL